MTQQLRWTPATRYKRFRVGTQLDTVLTHLATKGPTKGRDLLKLVDVHPSWAFGLTRQLFADPAAPLATKNKGIWEITSIGRLALGERGYWVRVDNTTAFFNRGVERGKESAMREMAKRIDDIAQILNDAVLELDMLKEEDE